MKCLVSALHIAENIAVVTKVLYSLVILDQIQPKSHISIAFEKRGREGSPQKSAQNGDKSAFFNNVSQN